MRKIDRIALAAVASTPEDKALVLKYLQQKTIEAINKRRARCQSMQDAKSASPKTNQS